MNYNNDDENDETESEQENLSSQENENSKSNYLNKKIQQKMSKEATKKMATSSALKSLLPILSWVIVIILIIIIIIGIVMFFITMPGMVMDKLKELSGKMANIIAAYFGGDTTTFVNKQQIYDVLDYLEEMGYDLKGYGFLTDYVGENKVDFERHEEELMCKYAKEKYNSDFIFITNFPYEARSFYVMKDENGVTQTYDLLFKGVEITSGAQRENRYDVLKRQIKERN